MEPPKFNGGKATSNKYVFNFLRKVFIVSEDLIATGSLFQNIGAAAEKGYLPIFSLVFGTKRCLETDDLRVLQISEKCSRFTKYVGC